MQADIDREIVTNLPDRADLGRFGLTQPEITLVGDLGNRANRPVMRSFEDRADEQIGMWLPSNRRTQAVLALTVGLILLHNLVCCP